MNSSKLSYRAEIDGLRAIALASVILYHAQIVLFGKNWFEGGFIGVDIFFVISGYLITRIILSELELKDSFSFLNFYERRARRILPMLFVVIFVSVPFAWQKLLPSDFIEYAESILTSLFFGSNFFFYFSTTEYGADSALLKPFLHTWSLGVEEQFYLVFPILAIIAFKYFRKHFLIILVGLSLLSLQFSELMEVRNADFNFYLPFSRFWELGVGSMLAYRELYCKPSNESFASKSLPIIGLFLVAYSILFFDGKTPHPSFHTLIPIIGVALIIGFTSKDELVGKVLGSKPFVWVGLISYSAYLWHFPIFAFSRMESGPTSYEKIEWVVLTVILSVLSYFFVEKPFRDRKALQKKYFVSIISFFLTTLIIFSAFVVKENGIPSRLPNIFSADFDQKPWTLSRHPIDNKMCYGRQTENTFCRFDVGASRTITLIGDSNIESLSPIFQRQIKDKGFNLMTMNSVACFYSPNTDVYRGSELNSECTSEIQVQRFNALSKIKNNYILIGGGLDWYLSNRLGYIYKSRTEDSVEQNIRKGISELLGNGNKVILFYPYPRADGNVSKAIFGDFRNASSVAKFENALENTTNRFQISEKEYLSYSLKSFDFLNSFDDPNLIRVFPHKLFCKDGVCGFNDFDNLYVVDENHPSEYMGSKMVAEIFKTIEAVDF